MQGTLRDLSKGGRNLPVDQVEPVRSMKKYNKIPLFNLSLAFVLAPGSLLLNIGSFYWENTALRLLSSIFLVYSWNR